MRAALGRRLRTPTLAIFGQDEPVVRREAFAGAQHVLGSGSEVVELPGIGHRPHLEAPDAVRTFVLDFLRTELPPSPPSPPEDTSDPVAAE